MVNIIIYYITTLIGSGLGLFLCKNLCELMGGEISVKSVYQEGTQFNFSIEDNMSTLDLTSHMGSVNEGEIYVNINTQVIYLLYIYIYI